MRGEDAEIDPQAESDRYDRSAFAIDQTMLRKNSRSLSGRVSSAAYQKLANRLEETERLLSTLMEANAQLQRQNQHLKQELRNLGHRPEGMEQPVTSPSKDSFTKVSSRIREQKLDTYQFFAPQNEDSNWRPRRGNWAYWLLTLTLAAAAGIATFYLVRTFGGSRF